MMLLIYNFLKLIPISFYIFFAMSIVPIQFSEIYFAWKTLYGFQWSEGWSKNEKHVIFKHTSSKLVVT